MKRLLEWIKKYKVSIVLGLYTILVIMVLVLKFPTEMVIGNSERTRLEVQLIPFKTIIEYATLVHSFTDWFIKNLVCNIVVFMPYGLLLPYVLNPKKVLVKICVMGTLFSTMIEIVQHIFAVGKLDIDDIILNVIGIVLGYLLYKIIEIVKHKFIKK